MFAVILSGQNDLRNNALQLASEEQRKADENVLRLVEQQKVRLSISFVFFLPSHAYEIPYMRRV